ncbi:MAG: hypothetical protein OES53_02980 [Xanthomonadales bacterium]|jgi:hypothetical protein|nr:hypothetical protein [Xanthomonadales bacterium]MDH3939506.1 hypothetical protein [Xanthomonadales bacterium]MDH4000889.1 hypothetical protein [Xanthomonadales bacterium]
MRSIFLRSAAFLTLFLAMDASAEQLLREFSGSRSTETVEFEVKAPWLVDWRVNSDYPSSMGIAVTLAYGGTDAFAGKVFKTKSPGNGLRLIEEGGRFRFKVDATITDWTLKVIQLSPDEVEQYKPKKVLDY